MIRTARKSLVIFQLVSNEEDSNIKVLKLSKELEGTEFATLPLNEIEKPNTLIANESDSVQWIESKASAVAIPIESKKIIRRIKSDLLPRLDRALTY